MILMVASNHVSREDTVPSPMDVGAVGDDCEEGHVKEYLGRQGLPGMLRMRAARPLRPRVRRQGSQEGFRGASGVAKGRDASRDPSRRSGRSFRPGAKQVQGIRVPGPPAEVEATAARSAHPWPGPMR